MLGNLGRKLDFGANYRDVADYIDGVSKGYLWQYVASENEKGQPWDDYANELKNRTDGRIDITDPRELLEVIDDAIQSTKEGKGKINPEAIEKAAEGNPELQIIAEILDDLESGEPIDKINQNIREWADYYELSDADIKDLLIPNLTKEQMAKEIEKAKEKDIADFEKEVIEKGKLAEQQKNRSAKVQAEIDRMKQMSAEKKEREIKKKNLRRQIMSIANLKGMTKKAVSDLKMKHAGYRTLTGKLAKTKISIEKLENLLKAVKKVRPRRVGHKTVVTKKTEKKIQKLKENLIKKNAMTEDAFKKILKKEVGNKTPGYVDAKDFITQEQGQNILKRMLDETEVVRAVQAFAKPISENPEIAKEVKKLEAQIDKKKPRDPRRLESMRYYCQQCEIVSGAPVFTLYQNMIDTHSEMMRDRGKQQKRLKALPNFNQIAKDEQALGRVSAYIASKSNLENRPAMPSNITPDEIQVAQEIERILKGYEHKVRTAKFFNYYYYNQPIPDGDRYLKEISKAVDIFETEGREALVEYLKTQNWGVIHSGYEPLQVYLPKIKLYDIPSQAVGKGHVKVRLATEYQKQEKNILQRLNSYMRQIDLLFNLHPQIQAMVRLFDDNFDKFEEPAKVKDSMETFLKNLKRYGITNSLFGKLLDRLYSQAMQAVIMAEPVLAYRNLFQNLAFEHDKSILVDPRNKKLNQGDIDFIETFALQTKPMMEEYFLTGEKALPGLEHLTGLVEKVALYPHSDMANRYWSFWAKKNQVDRAWESKTLAEKMSKAKFADMTLLEQKRALGILAKDGPEAMMRYVSKVHSDDIHFIYERVQRSPAEQDVLGKVIGNLLLFPRAYTEKLAHAVVQLLDSNLTFEQRYRGLKILLSVVAGGMLTGSVYTMTTGRKRNPYNPFELFSFKPGGLAWGTIETVSGIENDILGAVRGDERAWNRLSSAIPQAADMFIPLYDITLRGYEAMTDQKNVDRKAIRKIRDLIDNQYKVRDGAYKVKRNALEKWQYLIGGPGVDYKEKKNQPVSRIKRKD